MNKDISIGEIVALDFRAAAVFKEAGIDFCCGGKKSISATCFEKGIDQAELEQRLDKLTNEPIDSSHNFNDWDLQFLCNYIINTHHKFVLKSLPDLLSYTNKIASVHGENHPELKEVADLFSEINRELSQHLRNEEEVLFPAIYEVAGSGSDVSKKVITAEITRLSDEHEFAGGAMDKINVLTNNYSVPEDGCNTYHVTFKLLQQFEDDLHVHVHLENNILFPKALQLVNKTI